LPPNASPEIGNTTREPVRKADSVGVLEVMATEVDAFTSGVANDSIPDVSIAGNGVEIDATQFRTRAVLLMWRYRAGDSNFLEAPKLNFKLE
jgi:hypothetical protein